MIKLFKSTKRSIIGWKASFILILTLTSIIILLLQPVIADDVDGIVEKQREKERKKIETQNIEEQRMNAIADRIGEVTNIVEKLFKEFLKKGMEFDEMSGWYDPAYKRNCQLLKYNNKLHIINTAKCKRGKIGYIGFRPKGTRWRTIISIENYPDNKLQINTCGETLLMWCAGNVLTYTIELNSIFDSKELLEKRDILRNNIIKILQKTE